MRICFDARLIRPHWTGAGLYAISLLRALLEINSENDFVILVDTHLDPQHKLFSLAGRKNFVAVQTRHIGPRQHFAVSWVVNSLNCDVYHYPQFDLPLGIRMKSVVTIHDLKYVLHSNLFRGFASIKRMYIRLAMGLAVRRARGIIAVSESTKKDILRVLKAASDKVTVIPEALPFQPEQRELEYDNDVIRRLSKFQNGYLLFVGERRPHKNLVRLVLAYKKAKIQLPDIPPLIIAGRSYAEYDDPEVLTNDLGLSDRIVFLGYVSDPAKNALYANASALVFTSTYEGFGLPILEAMSNGIPVITSNISSMPEIAGNAALLVDPYCVDEIAKAIELMLSDSNLRRELVEKGYKRVSQFSWEKAANMTLKVYEQVCNKN